MKTRTTTSLTSLFPDAVVGGKAGNIFHSCL
jgi:hypothetical protein